MTNSEKIVYSIFGVTNKSTQDMAYAVDRMAELLFDQNQKLDGIKVGKAIYPVVGGTGRETSGRGEPEHSAADTCVLGCGKSEKSASLPWPGHAHPGAQRAVVSSRLLFSYGDSLYKGNETPWQPPPV